MSIPGASAPIITVASWRCNANASPASAIWANRGHSVRSSGKAAIPPSGPT
jgi:hypothetical protein